MDALHFVPAVSETFAIDIAEADYRQLTGLHKASQYVQSKLAVS